MQESQTLEGAIKKLADIIGEDKGLLFDMLHVRSLMDEIDLRKEALNHQRLASLKLLGNPFYYEYLNNKNNELLAELKKNERKKPENVFEIPKVEEDKVLHEIVKPHEGKVILIDFWATWCSPCRSAMREFASAKKSMMSWMWYSHISLMKHPLWRHGKR